MKFPLPHNESERLLVLEELQLLDSEPEAAFDDLSQLAAEICATPIALITVINGERQWFKARVGTEVAETPRELALCNHTICQPELVVVPDTQLDARFAGHPMVMGDPRIRFYAGAPLLTREGYAVGTLCVLDFVPRELSPQQLRTLQVLSRHVSAQIEFRRGTVQRREAEESLNRAHADLERRVAQRTQQLQMSVKQADAARRQVSNMVERMSDGMVALDAGWRFDYVNRKAGELMGREPISLLGQHLFDAFPGARGSDFFAGLEATVRDQEPRESEVFDPARDLWLECRCYPSEEGLSIFFQDINHRKETEKRLARKRRELEEAQSRLELAVRASDIGLWSWEPARDYVFYSAQYRQQLGFSEEEFPAVVATWRDRLHPEDVTRVWEHTRQYFQDPTGEFEEEYRIRHKDGSYRWMFVRAQVHCDAEGKPERMVGCHIDTTQRRATEEALRASQEQLRALAEHLLSVREEESRRIALELHDELGAALTGLKLDVAWVDRQLGRLLAESPSAPLRVRIEGINQLIDDTMESVRKVCHTLRPAVLDQLGLAAAIEWQCEDFQTRTGVQCRLDRDENFALEGARSTAAFRILQELLTNVARHAEATEVKITARTEGGQFSLVVADNGRGLPADAFERRKSFGLVGVRERALSAGGRAIFEPTGGGGTTVRISLPADASTAKDDE